MDVSSLVRMLLANDTLAARQWVADAGRARFDWSQVETPADLDRDALVVAAGIVEMMASRNGQPAPLWTANIPAAAEPVFLVQAARTLPRLRRLCETEGPEPLRRRRILAPPDFLTAA